MNGSGEKNFHAKSPRFKSKSQRRDFSQRRKVRKVSDPEENGRIYHGSAVRQAHCKPEASPYQTLRAGAFARESLLS